MKTFKVGNTSGWEVMLEKSSEQKCEGKVLRELQNEETEMNLSEQQEVEGRRA